MVDKHIYILNPKQIPTLPVHIFYIFRTRKQIQRIENDYFPLPKLA